MKITLSNGVSVNVDDSYADLPPAEQEATKQYILEQWQASQAKPKEAESTPPGERSAFVPGAIGSAAGITFGGTLHRSAMEKFPTTPPATTTTTTAAGKPSVTTQFISPEKVEERILKSGMPPNVREKVAGAGQPANWMRTAAGETHDLPEKFFQQATSMRGSGAEGGAQTLIDKDLKNLEKIKSIGGSDFKLSGAADTQLMLPKEVATERQAQLEGRAKAAGETRAKRLGALEQARLAEQAKAQAEAAKPINRLKEFGQQAASKVTSGGGELLSKLTQPFASNLTTKALTGFGAGYGGYDALQRFQRDEYLRGLLSLIGAGGDIATMSRHPAAMVPGLVAGLGAPALNMYLDKLAAEGKLPKGFASGGLAYLSNGGSSEKSEPFVGYPQIKRKGPSQNFVPQRGAALGYLDALLGTGPQTSSVLDPKSREYLEAYEKAEPYGIALMAAPFLGGPAKSLGRALGPKAAEMTENYLTRLGGIQNITPASNRLISSNKLPEFDIRFDKRVGEQEKLKNLRTTTENYQPDVPTVSLTDFVDRPFVTSMSDRTAGGKYLLGINDVDLKRPVNLLGGLPYMFNNPGQTWASAPGPVKQIMREAQMAKEFTGKEPLYIPWRMAPTGSDFAHMTGETMLAYAESAMGRDQKKALNNAIKNIYPDWKGIDNPASMEQFKSAPSKVRKQIQHVLNRDFRDEGGLSIGETRLAITDPRQATGKEGTILDIGEIFSDKPIIQVSGHASYPKGVPGRGIGTLDKEFNIFELMPKAVKQRGIKDPRNPSTEDIRALQMKPYTGVITEDLLKQLGYAEGGAVEGYAPGGAVGALGALAKKILPAAEREANKAKFLESSAIKDRLFHGTTNDITTFDPTTATKKTGNVTSHFGTFLSDNPKEASRYATEWGASGGNVMPVYAQLQNPYKMPYKEFDNYAMGIWNRRMADPDYDPKSVVKFGDMKAQRKAAEALEKHREAAIQDVLKRKQELMDLGHDGIIINIGGNREIIPFDSKKIKSATGNTGTFNPLDPDITKKEGGAVQHFNKGKLVKGGLELILPPAENAARTQIVGTIPTYKKAGEMFTERGATGQALDFSAGLGKGAEFLGPNTLTYEPFAQGWKPTFSKASEIPSSAFGKVANLNSLNVVPRETRDQMVLDIARAMERGGHGIITTRGPEVMTAKGVPGPEPASIITSRDTYQKGFTKQELEDYIRYMLGKGYDIDKIKLGPAGVYIQKKADGGLVEGMTAMDSNAAVDPLMPQPMPVSLTRGPDTVTNRMMPLDFTTMQAPMAMGETTPDMAPGLQALSSPMQTQAMTPTAAATQPMNRLMPPPITMSRPMGGLMPKTISRPMLKPRMPGIASMPKRYFR